MATFAEVYSGTRINKLLEREVIISENVFANSREYIKIVCGRLNSKFYNDERIVEAFKKAHNNGATIEIICGPEVDPNTKAVTQMCKNNIVEVWQSERWPKSHFWIVDGKDVRLEDPHTIEFQKNTHASILSDAKPIAEDLLKRFENLKREANKTYILNSKPLANIVSK